MNNTQFYLNLGVSSTKEDVKNAIAGQSKGLFPGAFCKIIESPDRNPDKCCVIHADGAGTKSNIAYIHYKEFGDPSIFRGIAYDSIAMNIDDLLCIGATDNFIVSNTIGRNAARIDKTILKELIRGYDDFADSMKPYGITISLGGGETADLGDLISTVVVDSTVVVIMDRLKIIDNTHINPGNVIVGLASFGKATYENTQNSGIGSNGFSAARHLLLNTEYAIKYPETYSNTLNKNEVYLGKYFITDQLPGTKFTIGDALLSPTRTYLPVINRLLSLEIIPNGIVHCTGGGQIKCKAFGNQLHYIKDNLFDTPEIFKAIRASEKISDHEMFRVFNMGHRMEIYCDKNLAQTIINIANEFDIEAKIIGYVEKSDNQNNTLTIHFNNQTLKY